MKFYSSDADKVITAITKKGSVKSLLLHGPNRGAIDSFVQKLAETSGFLSKNLYIKDLDAGELASMLNAANFFKQRELIKIRGTGNIISKSVKELLKDGNFINFPCFIAEDALPPSGIRDFFEKTANLASIGCYYEEKAAIAGIISKQCALRNKRIDKETLEYIASNITGDTSLILSEVEKICAFVGDKNFISLDDAQNSLSGNAAADADSMCINFAYGSAKAFLEEAEKIKAQNINEVLILRALIRYYMNLYITSLRLRNGESIDQAIKSLSPPIFFKHVGKFKEICRKTSIKEIIATLELLRSAEINFKKGSEVFDFSDLLLERKNIADAT